MFYGFKLNIMGSLKIRVGGKFLFADGVVIVIPGSRDLFISC